MSMTHSKSGGSKALATKPNLLNALRVQTSSYGQVIPIVYGQNRISGRLIWSGDFVVFRFGRTFSHGAIVLGWPLVIHSAIPHGVLLADAERDGELMRREAKIFQFVGCEHAIRRSSVS